ncbi:secA translation cis-regulator SecM [Testudinibacter sp. P80/BLE/0925]|uniref:secA translation cis-regulator SecM n=1 Tax=Testudinibacter sp. TW-1 TaxID=3417757 RepID=UPI003D366C00
MNLFRGYNKSARKPHFWSQFLLGMLAILSLPLQANPTQEQQTYSQAYQLQQSEQQKPLAPLFYQQQQRQIQLQQRIRHTPSQHLFVEKQALIGDTVKAVPPIRAGPHFSFS